MTARGRRPRSGPRRWKLLTPTVLWSVVILAMAPSFYGFTGGIAGFPTGRSAGRSGAAGVAAADLASATASAAGGTKGRRGGGGTASSTTGSAKGSPFAAASWLKDRVRDGKRRVHMQVRNGAAIMPAVHEPVSGDAPSSVRAPCACDCFALAAESFSLFRGVMTAKCCVASSFLSCFSCLRDIFSSAGLICTRLKPTTLTSSGVDTTTTPVESASYIVCKRVSMYLAAFYAPNRYTKNDVVCSCSALSTSVLGYMCTMMHATISKERASRGRLVVVRSNFAVVLTVKCL